jgi:hypothetical protein
MDTKTLIADAKVRFSHNSAKDYLREKYDSKFLVADQGGLFKADAQTIALLQASGAEKLILIDTFNNPVEVDRKGLLSKLGQTYTTVMTDYYKEWKELENKR